MTQLCRRPQTPEPQGHVCVPHVLLPAGRTQTGALRKMWPHLACAMRGVAVVEFISRAVHWGALAGGAVLEEVPPQAACACGGSGVDSGPDWPLT